jgi:L-rhamnose mutarotase
MNTGMKKFVLTLDLKNDEKLITDYELWHTRVWPEVKKSIKDAGIISMEIYRYHTRLFMCMETRDDFCFDEKARSDAENIKVQEWEALMWKFQQELPGVKPGEKWQLMKNIFQLTA